MTWDQQFIDALGRSALFLRRLSTLQPGQRVNLTMQQLQDMEFPMPLDERWTQEEKAEWFRSRAPFYCVKWENFESGDWVFEHVKT